MKFVESEDDLPANRGFIFTADWCGKCKKLFKLIEEEKLADSEANNWYKIDIDNAKELALKYDVQGVPMLVVVVDNKPELRLIGTVENFKFAQQKLTNGVQQLPAAQLRPITPELAFANQLNEAQLNAVHSIGFKSVLNLRHPEEPGFLPHEPSLLAPDITYANVPMKVAAGVTEEQIDAALAQMDALPKPLLVHCKRGFCAGVFTLLYAALHTPGTTTSDYLTWCQENGQHLPDVPELYEKLVKRLDAANH